ncbi:peptide ligase PGM1-related protein [Streptomyces sp. NPDC046942]|uniref:peptide ligase PGM1-related protein n=1 Tax=Streptomyces sp. NPDC046942 TaxID=3155137 RepID=UPI0033CD0782
MRSSAGVRGRPATGRRRRLAELFRTVRSAGALRPGTGCWISATWACRPGRSPLGYDPERATGVVLHMMSAAAEDGKFGAVCIGADRAEAAALLRGLRELVDELVRVKSRM